MPEVSAMTPAESGAIGAACEVPETAATTKVATPSQKQSVSLSFSFGATGASIKHANMMAGSATSDDRRYEQIVRIFKFGRLKHFQTCW
jgi:hypothetical protein